MKPFIQNFKTVVLADGEFPFHPVPVSFLRQADRIICCDGAAHNLIHSAGLEPSYIVGDLDSVSDALKARYASVLLYSSDQETNDLTKAVQFCIENKWNRITIVGATGKREDHTLGNLSLLADYSESADVQLLTDYGVFLFQSGTAVYESFPGQQVSVFGLSPATLFTTHNLVYPVKNKALTAWWQGTLNESLSEHFTIEMTEGKALVFREYPN
ncbi:MAG: thiamine diphosphokinase [Dysgonamonadaceae bacterium]|jgi:thiamine pyrophosphokinase|nr:thiamine diphosphokinase [Dysgonamonadaceae bacterium]